MITTQQNFFDSEHARLGYTALRRAFCARGCFVLSMRGCFVSFRIADTAKTARGLFVWRLGGGIGWEACLMIEICSTIVR